MSKKIIKELFLLAKKRGISNYRIAEDTRLSRGGLSEIKSGKKIPRLDTVQIIVKQIGAELLLSAPDQRTHPEILEIARQKIAKALTPVIKEKGLKFSDFEKIVNAEQYSIDEFFSLLAILDIHLDLSEKDAENTVWKDANPDNLN